MLLFALTQAIRTASRFWAAALRWQIEDKTDDIISLVPTDDTRFGIDFSPGAAPKVGKNRIHLDLTTTSADDQRGTVQTLIELGARHIDIGQGQHEPHVVMADPEGNEFCVIEPGNSFLADCGRLGSITCDGSPTAGYFWSEALGWPVVWEQDEETAIRAPDGSGPFITWGPPVPPKVGKNRLHLHIAPGGTGDQRAEMHRLVSLHRDSSRHRSRQRHLGCHGRSGWERVLSLDPPPTALTVDG